MGHCLSSLALGQLRKRMNVTVISENLHRFSVIETAPVPFSFAEVIILVIEVRKASFVARAIYNAELVQGKKTQDR